MEGERREWGRSEEGVGKVRGGSGEGERREREGVRSVMEERGG